MPGPVPDELGELARADEAAQFVFARTSLRSPIGVILGSGLGAFAGELRGAEAIPFGEIPTSPRPPLPDTRAGSLSAASTIFPWP